MIGIPKIVLFVVFVLSVVNEVFSIKCWVCDSNVDPKCGIPFDSSSMSLTDCSTLGSEDRIPNYCYTQRELGNGVERYKRNCSYTKNLTPDMSCMSLAGGVNEFGQTVLVRHCPCHDKDGCNDGKY